MIRSGVLAALALLLTACGARDARDPFTDSRIPPSLGPAYWPPQGWAWGLIQVGSNPPQRYGVAAPMDEPPLAQILMLPGYGGLAEETFKADNALLARRIEVWALDGVGQGGSGRIAWTRDLGHVDSFQGDVDGLRRLLADVVRPGADAPLIAVADGSAAPVLLRAAQTGAPGLAGIVLTDPRMRSPAGPRPGLEPAWLRWTGLSRRRAPGQAGWRRDAAAAPYGSLAHVRQAWQLANPDLRMGGPSLGWLAAFDQLTRAVQLAGWRGIEPPVLVLVDPAAAADARGRAARLCAALPHCSLVLAGADQWPAREGDFAIGVARAAALSNLGRGR